MKGILGPHPKKYIHPPRRGDVRAASGIGSGELLFHGGESLPEAIGAGLSLPRRPGNMPIGAKDFSSTT
jgi:hypothetical protein